MVAGRYRVTVFQLKVNGMKKIANVVSPRAWSNSELKKICEKLPLDKKVINISGWEDKDKESGFYKDYFTSPQVYEISNYTGDIKRGANDSPCIELDLTKPLPDTYKNKYDIGFHHTVLEHLEDPVFAFNQMAAITDDLLISVVPWKQKLHFEPGQFGDYYRFSPLIMRKYYEDNGFTVLYESYTPRPALDVYLFYVGSKKPENPTFHPYVPQNSGKKPPF